MKPDKVPPNPDGTFGEEGAPEAKDFSYPLGIPWPLIQTIPRA
jgi:hypothetical protein